MSAVDRPWRITEGTGTWKCDRCGNRTATLYDCYNRYTGKQFFACQICSMFHKAWGNLLLSEKSQIDKVKLLEMREEASSA